MLLALCDVGKTTMLNALAGRFEGGTVSGSVLVNGVPKDKSFKRVACYVPQEASLMGVLTVEYVAGREQFRGCEARSGRAE